MYTPFVDTPFGPTPDQQRKCLNLQVVCARCHWQSIPATSFPKLGFCAQNGLNFNIARSVVQILIVHASIYVVCVCVCARAWGVCAKDAVQSSGQSQLCTDVLSIESSIRMLQLHEISSLCRAVVNQKFACSSNVSVRARTNAKQTSPELTRIAELLKMPSVDSVWS